MSGRDVLEPEDFELEASDDKAELPLLRDERRRIERELVLRAMVQCQNNITQVAKVLGISRPTLYDLMRSLDLPPPTSPS
jgi:two-component system NtrC family response regulator